MTLALVFSVVFAACESLACSTVSSFRHFGSLMYIRLYVILVLDSSVLGLPSKLASALLLEWLCSLGSLQ